MIKLTWQCLFSPRLYKIYREGPRENQYQPLLLEKWSDTFILMTNLILKIGLYTSPLTSIYIYKRGFISMDETRNLTRLLGGFSTFLAFTFLIRAVGRASNQKYVEFLKDITNSKVEQKAYLEAVRKYDCEFSAWPASYNMSPKNSTSFFENHPFAQCANSDLPIYQRTFIQMLAYIATHTFGLRLIYPGSLGLIKMLLWTPIFHGRTALVEEYNGKRAKLQTAEGNHIDTMFVDHRARAPNGNILVICCEGNSGFYEVGIMNTPIKAGYSALGWNHPGFAESTGVPFPEQEKNAIDAVVQYAINTLGFAPERIVMFGWSIGGYAAAWAATQYPVKALILDATFDDLLPLAQNQMPASWTLLVKEVVRSYVDLNVAELVCKYSGPVVLVRRTEDEIICLKQGQLSSNRGNHLVSKIIAARHPEVLQASSSGAALATLMKYINMVEAQRSALGRADLSDRDVQYVQLITKYMRDYRSNHCTPLPEENFKSIMQSLKTTLKDE